MAGAGHDNDRMIHIIMKRFSYNVIVKYEIAQQQYNGGVSTVSPPAKLRSISGKSVHEIAFDAELAQPPQAPCLV
jgi:hypothetical protein